MNYRFLPVALLVAACSGPVGRELGGGASGLNVADAALRGGSPQVALQVVTGVLNSDPNNTQALLIQGDALTLLGRNDAAATSFERALTRSPSSDRAQIGLGRLRLGSNPAEAEKLFLDVLQRNPNDTTALNNLGIARDLQGRHADAQIAYRQALGVNPNMSSAQVNMALSMAMSGQGAAAISLIQPLATASGASRKIRHDYAAVLALSGRRTEAEQIMSADLTRDEVNQALAEYATVGPGGNAGRPVQAPPQAIPFQGSQAQSLPNQAPRSVVRLERPAQPHPGPGPSAAPATPVARRDLPAPEKPTAERTAPEKPVAAEPAAAAPEPVVAKVETPAVPGSIAPAPPPAIVTATAPVPAPAEATTAVIPAAAPVVAPQEAGRAIAIPAPPAAAPIPAPVPALSTVAMASPPAEAIATPAVADPKPDAAARRRSVIVRMPAVSTRDAALASWESLRGRIQDDIGGLTSRPVKSTHEADVWNLKVSGFGSSADADSFCTKIRANGAQCFIRPVATRPRG